MLNKKLEKKVRNLEYTIERNERNIESLDGVIMALCTHLNLRWKKVSEHYEMVPKDDGK